MKKYLGMVILIFCAVSYAESLYNEASFEALVSDHRAFKVGQTLTVLIYEQAAAATSADTDTKRASDFAASAEGERLDKAVGLDTRNTFEGGGSISRTGKLIATISVTVEEILESGEMQVRGEQLIEFNDESQFIQLTGRVRPEDISAENTVLSTRVGDASITYQGDGILGKQQKPGFFTRLFNWIF